MDLSTIIILGIFGVVILGIAIYYLLRFLKGSLKINLNSGSQNSGDELTGTLNFKAKKQIVSNQLSISIVGYERRRTGYGKNRKTTNIEVYRNTQTLEGNTTYASGFKTFDFKLSIPYQEQIRSSSISTGNSTVDMGIKAASMLAGGRIPTLKWRLEAVLDAEGVDLSKTQSLGINLQSKNS